MLKDFKILRDKALQIGTEVSQHPDVDENLKSLSTIHTDLDALEQGVFRIAVIAPFNGGKSTFVNALLGTDLLSMNLIAETAVITRVRYGEKPRLIVIYNKDNLSEQVPNEDENLTVDKLKEMLRIITTVQRSPEQEQKIREALKLYDSIPGKSNEEKIKEVIVEWDLELCKDGVEIIDTPGLFGRHENHNEITRSILPKARAVIFVFEPEDVGEASFSGEIRRYVQEANNSSLERKSQHIFFLINKIDQHMDKYELAVDELKQALFNIIQKPKILGVSSYYAMMARRFLNGEIPIHDLRKSYPLITIPDPDPDPEYHGYPLSGKALTEEHVPVVLEMSRIRQLEEVLERYLENRHLYLIENVIRTAKILYTRSIEQLDMDIQTTKRALLESKEDFDERIKKAIDDIWLVEEIISDGIKRIFFERSRRESNPNSMLSKVNSSIDLAIKTLPDRIRKEIILIWEKKKIGVGEGNATKIITELNEQGIQISQVLVKGLIKNLFTEIGECVVEIIEELRVLFNKNGVDIDNILLKQLGIERLSQNNLFNLDNMANSMQAEIEGIFEMSLEGKSTDIQNKVRYAISNAEQYQRKPGLFNLFLSIFGKDKKVRKFNQFKFNEELNELVREITEILVQTVRKQLFDIYHDVGESIDKINETAYNLAKGVVDFEIQTKKANLERLKEQLNNNEFELKETIKLKQTARERLITTLNRNKIIEEQCIARGEKI